MKRPSPGVCADCARPHVRVPAKVRAARRAVGAAHLALMTPDVRAYAFALFDHITLGVKTSASAVRQAHPAPPPPAGLGAYQIQFVDRLVVLTAFGQA